MSLTNRVAVALGVGVVVALVAYLTRTPDGYSDFDHLWVAARALLSGHDPYRAVAAWGYHSPLYYPAPAVLVAVPFAFLSMKLAYATFAGIGATAFAFTVTQWGWWPLVTTLSFAAISAVTLAQWSLVSAGIAGMPWLAWLAFAKPTTAGAVAVAYLPASIRGRALWVNVAAAVILLVLSFALVPGWVHEWRAGLATAHQYTMPVQYLPGVPVLLAALRWKRPEARLLVLLALAPQSVAPYDTLPLALVVRTRMESLVFVAGGLVAQTLRRPDTDYPNITTALHAGAPVLIACMYLPALVMVLRRPNVAP